MAKRVLSLWLPHWPTDRFRRSRARRRAEPAAVGPGGRDRAAEAGARPLALAAAQQGTHRLTAVDSLAAREGLSPGLLLTDARALCPGLQVEAAAPEQDAKALAALAGWCGRYSPWVAVDGADGLRLDISGCAHLFGGEEALLHDLAERFGGFAIALRAAIADGVGAAWAMARFGRSGGAVVPSGGNRQALAGLPVAALRLPPGMAEDLARLGLARIGDLCELPRAALAARFGPQPAERLGQALGQLDEPVAPRAPATAFWVRRAFAEPIGRLDDIAATAVLLTGELCRLLATAGQGARRLDLLLYLADGRVERIRLGLARPSRDPVHIERLFADRLPALEAGFGADVIALQAPLVEPLAARQMGLARGREADAPDLELLVDRLGNRLGQTCLARLVPQASHSPERAVRAVPPLAGPVTGTWQAVAPRPLQLLDAPEPVEAVAEVPDGPPVLFRWRGRMHRVRLADGPERIAPEWWRQAELDGAGLAAGTRDYYRIEDFGGRRFWLYRIGLYGPGRTAEPRWYLHGLFA